MRDQQQIWQNMHMVTKDIQSLEDNKPSSAVLKFIEFLDTKNIHPPQRLIDIGSGNGKFQKNYDEQEFKDFYKEFTLVDFQTHKKKAFKLNKWFDTTNYYAVLQKSARG